MDNIIFDQERQKVMQSLINEFGNSPAEAEKITNDMILSGRLQYQYKLRLMCDEYKELEKRQGDLAKTINKFREDNEIPELVEKYVGKYFKHQDYFLYCLSIKDHREGLFHSIKINEKQDLNQQTTQYIKLESNILYTLSLDLIEISPIKYYNAYKKALEILNNMLPRTQKIKNILEDLKNETK